jgi:hypothetical protein
VLATALLAPDAAPVAALLAAAALALHAVRVRAPEEAAPPEIVTNSMYRGAPADPLTSEEISLLAARPIVFVRAETDAQLRLTLGALALTHVGLTGLASESAPSLLATHELLLDVGLAFLTLALLVRTRRAWSLTPLALGLVHLAVVEGWLVWPHDALELGVWAISLGFSTLGISVALSVHHVPSRSAPEVGSWDRLLDREADASRNAGATNAAAGGGGVLTRPS